MSRPEAHMPAKADDVPTVAPPVPRLPILLRIKQSIGFDWHIALPVALLSVFGLMMIYSTGGKTYLTRQLLWLPIALAGMLACYRISHRALHTLAYPVFGLAMLLLVVVLFAGQGPAHRWLSFGTVNLQPSELAKIACVLAVARYFADRRAVGFRFVDLALPTAMCLVPLALVLIEPDLGSSMTFVAILGGMLFWQGLSLFHIFLFFSPLISLLCSFSIISWTLYFAVLVGLLIWQGRMWEKVYGFSVNILVGLLTPVLTNHLHDYQKARVTTFLMPWLDPKGMGWNAIQSMITAGSGRFLGNGLFAGTQKRLSFLPNRHTDFIYACIGEEAGFVGSVLVLAAYVYLIYRFLVIAQQSKDSFASMTAAGLLTTLVYHVLVNTSMVLGLLPITGVALPFLSYGGSTLLLNYMIIGLILNVRYRS